MNQKPLFLAVTLTALLVIGGTFWQMQKRQVAMNQPAVTDPVVETPTQTEQENPIDTSDWKTYRNNTLGFEIKLPKLFKMTQPNDKENYFLFSDSIDKTLDQGSISFEVISYEHLLGKQLQNVDNQSLTNVSYAPYLFSRNIVLSVENRKVNNIDVRLFEYQFNEAPPHHSIEAWIKGYKEKEVFFQCNVGVCAIKTFSDNFSLDKEKMFFQIISSLSLIK